MPGEHPITRARWPPASPQPGSSNHGKLGLQIMRQDKNAIVFRLRQRHPPGRDQQHRQDRRPADPGSVAGQRHPYRGGRTPHPRR